MSRRYELKTIQDIYKKVPPEKWDLCLDEMKALLRHWKSLEDEWVAKIPWWLRWIGWGTYAKKIVWVDDDKGTITSTLDTAFHGTVTNQETICNQD